MTKGRERKFKSLPLLGKMKEGIHLIGKKGKEIVCIVRKIKFKQEATRNDGHNKYENQRYGLFSKFDEGIKLDKESWFSVTHEVIANHIAKTCKNCEMIMDGFAGVGGNVIAFAKYSKVIAVDIDKNKLDMLENNAKIYGVNDNIISIMSDFLEVKLNQKVDVVFASPPWGGPDYIVPDNYDFSKITPSFSDILKKSFEISSNQIFYLPKNMDPVDLYEEIKSSGVPINQIELQIYYINKKVKGIGCFCGDIVHPIESHVSYLKSI